MHSLAQAKQTAQTALGRLHARIEHWPPGSVVLATFRGLREHEAPVQAASLAYYGLFSIFPLLLGLIALLSLFLDPEAVERDLLEIARQNLPGTESVVISNVRGIIRNRGALGAVAMVGLLWSGGAVFGALTRILNRAWNITAVPPFYVSMVRRIVLAVGVGILLTTSLAATALAQLAADIALRTNDPAFHVLAPVLPRIALQFGSFISALAVLMLVYQFGTTAHIPWRHLWPGALLAGLLFEVAKNAFVFYLREFATFQQVYGSLSSVVALLLWVYVSGLILIVGAEFGAAMSRQHRGEI